MKTVSNLELASALLIAIVGVSFFALSPVMSGYDRLLLYCGAMFVSWLIWVATSRLQSRIKTSEFWVQPINEKLGKIVVSTVIGLLLLMTAFIIFLVA